MNKPQEMNPRAGRARGVNIFGNLSSCLLPGGAVVSWWGMRPLMNNPTGVYDFCLKDFYVGAVEKYP